MTIKHLKVFLRVYETCNITKAADLLHMTQPAVSRSITELENFYGVSLFDRINRRIYPTPIANELYGRASEIIGAFDSMEFGLQNHNFHTTLRVGTGNGLGFRRMPYLIGNFRKENPDTPVSLCIANVEKLQRMLINSELDIVISGGIFPDENLSKEFIADVRVCAIMQRGHPLAGKDKIEMSDLYNEPLILRETGDTTKFIETFFAMNGIAPNIAVRSNSSGPMIRSAACGLGITFMSKSTLSDEYSNILVAKEIEDADIRQQFFFIYHKDKLISNDLKALMDSIRRGFND